MALELMADFYVEMNNYYAFYHKLRNLRYTSQMKEIQYYLKHWPRNFPHPTDRVKEMMRGILRNLEIDFINNHVIRIPDRA